MDCCSRRADAVRGSYLPPLTVFRVQDAVTGREGHLRQVIVGVTQGHDDPFRLLRDEEVLELLNRRAPGQAEPPVAAQPGKDVDIEAWLSRARQFAEQSVDGLRLPFVTPLVGDLALFWPAHDVSG